MVLWINSTMATVTLSTILVITLLSVLSTASCGRINDVMVTDDGGETSLSLCFFSLLRIWNVGRCTDLSDFQSGREKGKNRRSEDIIDFYFSNNKNKVGCMTNFENVFTNFFSSKNFLPNKPWDNEVTVPWKEKPTTHKTKALHTQWPRKANSQHYQKNSKHRETEQPPRECIEGQGRSHHPKGKITSKEEHDQSIRCFSKNRKRWPSKGGERPQRSQKIKKKLRFGGTKAVSCTATSEDEEAAEA